VGRARVVAVLNCATARGTTGTEGRGDVVGRSACMIGGRSASVVRRSGRLVLEVVVTDRIVRHSLRTRPALVDRLGNICLTYLTGLRRELC